MFYGPGPGGPERGKTPHTARSGPSALPIPKQRGQNCKQEGRGGGGGGGEGGGGGGWGGHPLHVPLPQMVSWALQAGVPIGELIP